MEVHYATKYLIVGPWPRNRKIVKEILEKNTTLKVSPRKLRPIQLAHSDKQVAIGDANMAFNNANISVNQGVNDVETMRKYNIKLIYVSSSKQRESHILLRKHIEEYEDLLFVKLPEPMFEREALGVTNKLSTMLTKHWKWDEKE